MDKQQHISEWMHLFWQVCKVLWITESSNQDHNNAGLPVVMSQITVCYQLKYTDAVANYHLCCTHPSPSLPHSHPLALLKLLPLAPPPFIQPSLAHHHHHPHRQLSFHRKHIIMFCWVTWSHDPSTMAEPDPGERNTHTVLSGTFRTPLLLILCLLTDSELIFSLGLEIKHRSTVRVKRKGIHVRGRCAVEQRWLLSMEIYNSVCDFTYRWIFLLFLNSPFILHRSIPSCNPIGH